MFGLFDHYLKSNWFLLTLLESRNIRWDNLALKTWAVLEIIESGNANIQKSVTETLCIPCSIENKK